MSQWTCGITDCQVEYRTAKELILHQATEHPKCECKVCGEKVYAGYLAIRHAFMEHTRAQYVRAYDADSDDIRIREQLNEVIENQIDIPSLVNHLNGSDEKSSNYSD